MIMRHCDQCGKATTFEDSAGWSYGFANRACMDAVSGADWMNLYYENAGGESREDSPRKLSFPFKRENIKRFDLCSANCFLAYMAKHFSGAM